MSRKALDVYYAVALSKHDLKPSGTFFWKFACDLGFAAYVFNQLFCPKGRLSARSFWFKIQDTKYKIHFHPRKKKRKQSFGVRYSAMRAHRYAWWRRCPLVSYAWYVETMKGSRHTYNIIQLKFKLSLDFPSSVGNFYKML